MESLETSKIRNRIIHHFTGNGIDVGCSRDPLTLTCVAFDKSDWPEITHGGDARALPFENNHFDWLWSSHALEDFEEPGTVLREWLRVVKPGGIIGLYVPHPFLYAKYGSGNTDHKVPGFYPYQLENFMKALGCEILESTVDGDVSDKHSPHYSTLMIARKNGL